MATNAADRVAIVTGAASGIGRAIAHRLAADGMRVAIADISDATATVEEITSAGGDAFGAVTDCADAGQVENFCKSVMDRYGRIDVLVHNAGIYPRQPFAEITLEDWHRVISVNLNSLFYLTRACVPVMQSNGWGRIIGLASNTFYIGIPNLSHYQASKGGVIGFIRGLSTELGEQGITCNSIAPTLTRTTGTTETSRHEPEEFEFIAQLQSIKRTGEPEDVVGAVAFLVSDPAAFMTGQTLSVDGGFAKL